MMRAPYCVLALICGISVVLAAEPKHSYMPAGGYVPDATTAIKIAVAVWEPIYGRDHIAQKKPFHATLKNGIWTVEGSLPKGWLGGVPEAEIAQKDGRILRISHGR
jgi:NTF2 fold immunity protein